MIQAKHRVFRLAWGVLLVGAGFLFGMTFSTISFEARFKEQMHKNEVLLLKKDRAVGGGLIANVFNRVARSLGSGSIKFGHGDDSALSVGDVASRKVEQTWSVPIIEPLNVNALSQNEREQIENKFREIENSNTEFHLRIIAFEWVEPSELRVEYSWIIPE